MLLAGGVGDGALPEAAGTAAAPSPVRFEGDLLARAEAVRDTPNPAHRDFDRFRLRFRPGVIWEGTRGWSAGLRLRGSVASDSNEDNRPRFDNFRSDEAALDRLWTRWDSADGRFGLHIGATEAPLSVSSALWDRDLAWQGVALELALPAGGLLTGHRLVGGATWGSQGWGDRSQILSLQWVASLGVDADLSLAYWHFDELEELIDAGLARQNRLAPGGDEFLSDFDIIELRAGKSWLAARRPLLARLSLLANLGADDRRTGVELAGAWGGVGALGDWRLRYTFQRIEQDAALGAFTADEWWFHSDHRGHLAGFAVGLGRGVSIELAGMIQRRDDADEDVTRVFLDLVWTL
jgi:hypothetical protein